MKVKKNNKYWFLPESHLFHRRLCHLTLQSRSLVIALSTTLYLCLFGKAVHFNYLFCIHLLPVSSWILLVHQCLPCLLVSCCVSGRRLAAEAGPATLSPIPTTSLDDDRLPLCAHLEHNCHQTFTTRWVSRPGLDDDQLCAVSLLPF